MKYRHIRTGKIYTVLYREAVFKNPVGDWVNAVVYRAEGTTYVRLEESFLEKFKEVK